MTTGTNDKKLKAFNDALKHLNAQKGLLSSETGTLIAKLSERPMDVETISTGSLVLDSILGGGIAKGRIAEFYGAESSGKTSIALNAIANVQREGGTAAFIDLENALDPKYARVLGVNTDELAVAQPDYAEQALELVEQLAASGAIDIIVVDSVAALVPKLELEGDMDQNSIGLVARLMSRALKKLVSTANRTKTTVIFINQTRDAIGGFSPMGTPTTTTGGKALRFFASQRVEIKKGLQVKDGKEAIGNIVKYTVKKNKVAPPFKVGETVLSFGKGINRPAEMIEVGPDLGIIDRPNSRTYVEAATGEVIAKSKAEAVQRLEEDSEMYERLADALKKRAEEGADFEKKALAEELDKEIEEIVES